MHGAVEVPGRVEDDLSRFQNEGLDVRKKVDPTSFSQHYLTVADVQ